MLDCKEVDAILSRIGLEVVRASELHPPIRSRHEAFAVVKEELDEAWEVIRGLHRIWDPVKREFVLQTDDEALAKELVQTAAMCVRTIVDLQLLVPQLKGAKGVARTR